LHKIWLLKLVPDFPYGRLLCSLTIFVVLQFIFSISEGGKVQASSSLLFFSVIIAYIIPVFSHITDKSIQALDDLRPVMLLSDEQFVTMRHAMDHKSIQWVAITLLVGFFFSIVHLSDMAGSPAAFVTTFTKEGASLTNLVGTILVWIVMTTVIGSLTNIARLFALLGRSSIKVNLLETRSLIPFARVAISSTLALIGALASFPLMFLDESITFLSMLPAVLATTVPMLGLFIMPLWPVHKLLLKAKEQELNIIDAELRNQTAYLISPASDIRLVEKIDPLLNYRREIAGVSTWPFDMGALTRLGLYLVIPPLTWIGAALIEKLLDLLV